MFYKYQYTKIEINGCNKKAKIRNYRNRKNKTRFFYITVFVHYIEEVIIMLKEETK